MNSISKQILSIFINQPQHSHPQSDTLWVYIMQPKKYG